jgi:hypothetical protein
MEDHRHLPVNPKFSDQGCANPRRQVTWATISFKVAPNICGSSVWTLLHVTNLALRIKRRRVHFGKCVHPCSVLSI